MFMMREFTNSKNSISEHAYSTTTPEFSALTNLNTSGLPPSPPMVFTISLAYNASEKRSPDWCIRSADEFKCLWLATAFLSSTDTCDWLSKRKEKHQLDTFNWDSHYRLFNCATANFCPFILNFWRAFLFILVAFLPQALKFPLLKLCILSPKILCVGIQYCSHIATESTT